MATPVERLSLLRPSAEETDLLRACLWSGAPAREAWLRWQRAVGSTERAIKANVSGVKSLLPLLHYGLLSNGAVADSDASATLRAAALNETIRYGAYASIAARACTAATTAGIAFLVLKGAALEVIAYPQRALRHSHDVDVLIRAEDIDRVLNALRQAGFTDGRRDRTSGTAEMRDPSGLPVTLHDRLYRVAYYTPPLADIWGRAQTFDLAGANALTLSAADHLVHVCGHAACCASRDRLKWAADAWFLIERTPRLDWETVIQTAHASRLTLPLAALLDYLATELNASIPTPVRERLSHFASTADRTAREIALSGIRGGKRGTFRNLLAATRTVRGRIDLVRWMVLPLPSSLRLGAPLPYPKAWPACYVTRPLMYIARRARRALAPASVIAAPAGSIRENVNR